MSNPQQARAPLPRPSITRIEVHVEGREDPYVLEGDVLHDPLGGVLAWNDFAVHQLVAPFYDRTRAHNLTGLDVIRWWHGRSSQLGDDRDTVPPFLIRPICQVQFPEEE